VVFATGSSFRKDIGTKRPAGFWDRLLDILCSVDVISLSSAEHRQLDAIYGDGWRDRALHAGTLKFLVAHSSKDATIFRAVGADALLESADAMLEIARAEATRHASRALTGLGARFDGVLSAAMLLSWACE
jgi:hypothetical protein